MPYKNKGLQIGNPISRFILPDQDGKMHSSDELFKQPTLLYFLRGTW